MVKLRGHHLICLHFFRGEGYRRGFVDNLSKALKTAERMGVVLVEGGDDVCAACPNYQNERCAHKPGMDEKVKRLDLLARKLLKVHVGGRLSWSQIREQLPNIIREWKKQACLECEWIDVCKTNENWNFPI